MLLVLFELHNFQLVSTEHASFAFDLVCVLCVCFLFFFVFTSCFGLCFRRILCVQFECRLFGSVLFSLVYYNSVGCVVPVWLASYLSDCLFVRSVFQFVEWKSELQRLSSMDLIDERKKVDFLPLHSVGNSPFIQKNFIRRFLEINQFSENLFKLQSLLDSVCILYHLFKAH